MSELIETWSDKLAVQYKQLNKNLEKIATAGKGLFARLKDTSTQQFNALVAEGEKTDEDLIDQVKSTVTQPFSDIRGSVSKAKLASVGLIVRVKEEGNRYFDQLVTEGEKIDKPKAKASSSKSKQKAPAKAA